MMIHILNMIVTSSTRAFCHTTQAARKAMTEHLKELVAANRILAHEGVVDAYGHVSLRSPNVPANFFMSRSRSPELVGADDILEFGPEGEATKHEPPPLYAERYIHAAIYERRPDVCAIVHSHAYDLIPYSVTGIPLRPIFHSAARIGASVPVWDINERFGDTNLLVLNMEQGRDLASALADNRVILMRGHGVTVVGSNLHNAVVTSIYAQVNARLQMLSMQMGPITYLTPEELKLAGDMNAKGRLGADRTWEYLKRRAGCDD
jgi:ribulose-5-phosphate 4-epimerase/fuculose-1-phosphate aldolase